jgi:Flp pilus assembly protein TadD
VGSGDLKAAAPFLLISLVLVWLTIHSGEIYNATEDLGAEPDRSFLSRLALIGLSSSFYFTNFFWPLGLLPMYPLWPIDPPAMRQFLPGLVMCAGFGWLWVRRRDWGRHALLGMGFFLVMLAPFLGLHWISYMKYSWVMDHFLYIPDLGLIGLVVAGLEHLDAQIPSSLHRWGVGAVAMGLASLAWESHLYAGLFVNQETLWTYTTARNPQAWLAHNNLGNALVQRGDLSDAIEHYRLAVRIEPGYATAHCNLGTVLMQTGRIAEAAEQFQEALNLKPNYVEAHNNMGNVLLQTGQVPEAVEQFEQTLKIKPDYAEAHYNLGNALARTGRAAEAIQHYEQALSIDPGYIDAYNNLGIVLAQMGRVPEAIAQFEQALKIAPNDVGTQNNLRKAEGLLQAAPAKN